MRLERDPDAITDNQVQLGRVDNFPDTDFRPRFNRGSGSSDVVSEEMTGQQTFRAHEFYHLRASEANQLVLTLDYFRQNIPACLTEMNKFT